MNKKKHLHTVFAVACLAAYSNAFAADGLSINVGTEYSTGTYGGSDRNTVVAVPISAKYRSGRFIMRLSVPWLSISGTGVVTSGIGGVGSADGTTSGGSGGSGGNSGPGSTNSGSGSSNSGPGSSNSGSGSSNSGSSNSSTGGTSGATRSTEHGFGDIVAALTYNAVDANGLLLDITGRIKFPTASESRGLGNGKTDYALLLEAEQAVGKGFINGGVGHKWLGEPAGVTLRNPWFGAIGGGIKPSANTTLGVSYDHSQSSRSGGIAAKEVSLYASQRLSKNIKLNANVFKGLSDGSPDWGAGLGLGYNF